MVAVKTREQIRDLVKRYALACNAMLEARENNAMDLYPQIWDVYLAGQMDIVIAATKELLSSDELPEPVRSYWKADLEPKDEKKTEKGLTSRDIISSGKLGDLAGWFSP
jgi:hypothetical protein